MACFYRVFLSKTLILLGFPELVPPKKTFINMYKLYFESCTTVLLLVFVKTQCLGQIFLYKKQIFLFIED